MSQSPGTLQVILRLLRRIVSPLTDHLTVDAAPGFFVQLGVPMTPTQAASIAGPLSAAAASVTNHVQSVDDLDHQLDSGDLAGILSSTANALLRVVDLFHSLPALGIAVGGLPTAPANFAATFPQRLFDHLATELLNVNRGTNEVLEFLGILDRQDLELPGPPPVPYTISTLDT